MGLRYERIPQVEVVSFHELAMLNAAKETSVFLLNHLASFSMLLPAALHTDTPLPGDTESVKIECTLH